MINIIEGRTKSLLFTAYRRLLIRLSQHSSKRAEIVRDFENIKIGFSGEKRVDRAVLETHFSDIHYILPNVELRVSQNRQIEIDTLIITRSFICILEVKNLKGHLKFNENPYSLHQNLNGNVFSYPCPQMQVKRAGDSLNYWLKQHFNLDLPIHKAIILPNEHVLLETPPTQEKLLGLREIPLYLQSLEQQPHFISAQQLNAIISKLKEEQHPYNHFPLSEKYHIPLSHLQTGVMCQCGGKGIRQTQRTWLCNLCEQTIPQATENAVLDWFLLFKSSITHEECKKYLQECSQKSITRLISRTSLLQNGNNRSRKYIYRYNQPHFNKLLEKSPK